jgi:hypothetical protein
VVGRRGEVGGGKKVGRGEMFWGRVEAGEKIYIWAVRMSFWFIPKTG